MRNRRPGNSGENTKPNKPRLALIGFRGVGKSAIARRLAEAWEIPALSLDEKIESNAGMKIDEIVRLHGWEHFRDLEFEALQSAALADQLLMDCGGGVVEEANGLRSERKLAILQQKFFCIYISMNEERMLARLKNLAQNPSRPALTPSDTPEKLIEVFRRREPLYLEVAHAVVDVSDTNVLESAGRIVKMFVSTKQKDLRR